MGARPSSFKQGGGFLNNVDGVITGYEFVDEFPGGDGKKSKKFDSSPIYFVLSVRVDGADEDVTTTLKAAYDVDDFEISKDGLTLTPNVEGNNLPLRTSFGLFLTTLVDAGFPETNLPEDEINFEAIIGWRVRFEQKVNDEKTKKYGMKKSKDGKEFTRKDLVVTKAYGPVESKNAKSGGKSTVKAGAAKTSAAAKGGKVNGAAKGADEVQALAVETLIAILNDTEDGVIAKAKLPMKITTKMGKHPLRDDVRKLIYTEEFLTAEGNGYIFDQADQMIGLG